MVVGISLDEVLRNFIDRFTLIYQKYDYTDKEIDYINNPIKDPELLSYFTGFESKDELNHFMYEEAALEIFGHAGQMRENLMNELNKFLIRLDEKEMGVDVKIVSREAINSIPASYFFLSKSGCRVNNVNFVTKFEDKWDHVDILFTANPRALEAKPDNKVGIKVNCSYNEHVTTDFEIDKIEDFFKFEEEFHEITNKTKELLEANNKV